MQTPGQPKSLRAPKRGATEGNQIWTLYRGLNWTQAKDFRELLTAKNVPFATFQKQSRADRALGSVPSATFHLYRNYFFENTGQDLFAALEKETPGTLPTGTLQ